MKRPTTTDAAQDAQLNGIRLPDGQIVSWAQAIPRITDESLAAARPVWKDGEVR